MRVAFSPCVSASLQVLIETRKTNEGECDSPRRSGKRNDFAAGWLSGNVKDKMWVKFSWQESYFLPDVNLYVKTSILGNQNGPEGNPEIKVGMIKHFFLFLQDDEDLTDEQREVRRSNMWIEENLLAQYSETHLCKVVESHGGSSTSFFLLSGDTGLW